MAAIEELGGSRHDVIRTRVFLADMSQWREVGRAHHELFGEALPRLQLRRRHAARPGAAGRGRGVGGGRRLAVRSAGRERRVSTADAYRAAAGRVWAGAASVDVTPPRGIAMAGWSNQRHEVSTGTHGTLRTSALVLGSEDAPQTALLVLEVCVLTNPEAAVLRRRVGEALRLPPRAVRVSATHAHSCPALNEICGSWLRAGRDVLETYRAELLERSVRCAVEAAGRLRPARARHARGESSVPVYRRVVSAGRVRVGLDRQAPVRRCLDAVRLDDADGRRIATIAALGAHPTVLAGGNELVSAEFPGVARQIVEDVSGAPCLYLQGAAADVGPRRSFTDRVEDVESLGAEIGHHVLALVEQADAERNDTSGEPDVDASWLVLPAARPVGAFVPDDLAVLSRDAVLPVRADLGDPVDLVRAAAAAEAALYEARDAAGRHRHDPRADDRRQAGRDGRRPGPRQRLHRGRSGRAARRSGYGRSPWSACPSSCSGAPRRPSRPPRRRR